jgi:hypothetical protein
MVNILNILAWKKKNETGVEIIIRSVEKMRENDGGSESNQDRL